MDFYTKLKWVLGIIMIFVLIVATNLIDRKNFLKLKDSVTTIYEDRLIASNIIFEMLNVVQEKELALATNDSAYYSERNEMVNNELELHIARFKETKLTANEGMVFSDLQNNIEQLKIAESVFVEGNLQLNSEVENAIAKVKESLSALSKIQLTEGGKQMAISKSAIGTVELFTQLEIYLLVFLAIVVQMVVMYKPKKGVIN